MRLGRRFGDKSARGFDATFSAPKSVSVLWALSPDPWVRAEVLAAHDAAVDAAMGWFQRHGAVTRRGRVGVFQVDTLGVTAALFRQVDLLFGHRVRGLESLIVGFLAERSDHDLCSCLRRGEQRSLEAGVGLAVRSRVERGDELLLCVGLDGLVAVVGSHPSHSVVGGSAGEDGEASECGAGSTVAAETPDLDPLTLAGAVEKVSEGST